MASHGHICFHSARGDFKTSNHTTQSTRSAGVIWCLGCYGCRGVSWWWWDLAPEHPSRAALRKPWRAYLGRWVQRQISVRFILSRKNCPKDLFRVCVNILGMPQRKPQIHWKQSFSLLKPREMECTAFGRPGDWLKVVGLVGVLPKSPFWGLGHKLQHSICPEHKAKYLVFFTCQLLRGPYFDRNPGILTFQTIHNTFIF